MFEDLVEAADARRAERPTRAGAYGVDADALESYLDARGVSVSSGSACSSHRMKSSHVLQALGDEKAIDSSLRFSLSKYTTEAEIESTARIVHEVVGTLRPSTENIK